MHLKVSIWLCLYLSVISDSLSIEWVYHVYAMNTSYHVYALRSVIISVIIHAIFTRSPEALILGASSDRFFFAWAICTLLPTLKKA